MILIKLTVNEVVWPHPDLPLQPPDQGEEVSVLRGALQPDPDPEGPCRFLSGIAQVHQGELAEDSHERLVPGDRQA